MILLAALRSPEDNVMTCASAREMPQLGRVQADIAVNGRRLRERDRGGPSVMSQHQYFVVDGPFAGELEALDLEQHVNEVALEDDDGHLAVYKLDGDAALVFVANAS
jgi:hypothetical protein